ncbi:MAG: sulfate adenylyltransferase subunit CysN [Brevundimonas sp.]|uniref:sulfate adenylyltransferase subunit CysN n=1 Tax=Brevundimonas sp. TaxID=1871086 RepID=UPI004033CEA2
MAAPETQWQAQAGAEDIDTWIAAQTSREVLRFITCGSVDDGKSTLIGRLLYDSRTVLDDQMAGLEADSKRIGTQGGALDFALLVDGLAAEREQGITIDVAYRYFSTERRGFIAADTPGHEQYTRNMATGASTADVAIILVDARKGVLTQTRRHSFIVSLMGVRRLVLAVNKMDLIDFDPERFEEIVADYRDFAAQLGLTDITAIPLSGLNGDNIIATSPNTPWYAGPSLIQWLETVPLDAGRAAAGPFRMPVQWVNRPNPEFRGFSGLIVSGAVSTGDPVRVEPSGRASTVARIVTRDGDLTTASAGQSVTLTLTDEIDCARGDVICAATDAPQVADQFDCEIVWMSETPLIPGRPYLLKVGARTVTAQISDIRHRVDPDSLHPLAARHLNLNDIGRCTLSLDRTIPFDAYVDNPDMGGFILIDRTTSATLGAGMIHFALRRSQNLHWQALDVTGEARARAMGQTPGVVWFTGLSGAGKSTVANLVEKRLHAEGRRTYLLDGDNVRHGLNRDLGFSEADRVENIRRVAEVARLMADAGLIVLTAFISPFRAERRMARERMDEGRFFEVFIDTPLAEAERRDPKGLYAKARAGTLSNFTGVDSPYEAPEHAELVIDGANTPPEAAAELIVERLRAAGWLDAPKAD